mmetsp:Transcript_38664/g.59649  ORF Transcript_38664/g.59649 Transcript_38664/m.59649 type:complete len:180 (+) Transcript_38664:92-631(+)
MAASLLWTSVFIFLIMELGLTYVLVMPVPRKIRNWICRETAKLDLKKRLRMPLVCIGFALTLAMFDSLSFLQLIFAEEKEEHDSQIHHHGEDALMFRHLEKEKEYRTERNIYLSGFALTLIFVIGRITDLMQEHVDLEDHLEKVRLSSKPAVESAIEGSGQVEIEMKEIPKKPIEKKND